MNGTHQVLAYADDVNLIGDDIRPIERNAEVNNLKEKILAWTRVRILVQARIFSLKFLIYDLPDDYSES